MPKRRAEDVEAALDTDQAHTDAQRAAAAPQTPTPSVKATVNLPEAVATAIDRYVYDQKRSGNRGFSRSQVFKEALVRYLEEKNLL